MNTVIALLILMALCVIAGLVSYAVNKTKPRHYCPTCNSKDVRQLSKEPLQVKDRPNQAARGVVIGSFRAHVRYELKYECRRCHARWQYETSAPPD